MCLNKCAEIQAKIKKLKQLEKIMEEFQAYTSRKEQLKEIERKARQEAEVLDIFRDKGLGDISVSHNIYETKENLKQIKEDFTKDPTSILQRNKLNLLNKNVSNINLGLQLQFKEHWQKYKAKQVINVNEELLQVLINIPGFSDAVGQVKARARDIALYHEEYPQDIGTLDSFHRRAGALKDSWDTLDIKGMPESVWIFLKGAVSPAGASLDTVNHEVLEWLQQNRVKEHFRVVSGPGDRAGV